MVRSAKIIPFLLYVSVVLYFCFVCVHIAHAQTQGFVPLSGIGGANSNGQPQPSSLANIFQSGDLSSLVSRLFTFAILFSCSVAVIQIMRGGLYYESATTSGTSQAKIIWKDVAIGLFLLLSIWLILNVINPCILNLNVLQSLSQNGGAQTCTHQ